MTRVIITGGSGGLGTAIANAMVATDKSAQIINWSKPSVDVTSRYSISRAIDHVMMISWSKVDILINCAGVAHIDYLPNMAERDWDTVMDTNAKGIFLATQALLSRLRGGTVLNITSNAAHKPMTASLAYNASKAAAVMMTKQMSRELSRTNDICVFSISPNKLAGTPMSDYIDKRVPEVRGWTPEYAKDYELAGLPAGEETDLNTLAEFIAFLLSTKKRHQYLAGCDIPYGL
jgi:NAD(P)-dependent dehydrogenase (short-subunit alcohol dehydrogenase family)